MAAPGKIGIFGGTFDPVHLGHTIVAEWICDALKLDKVVFVPNNIHPFQKRKNIIDARQRLEMLRLAISRFSRFELSTFEMDRPEVSYTVETLSHFRELYPQADLFCIVGTDNLAEFRQWKNPDRILELARLVVYPRKIENTAALPEHGRILNVQSPLIEISSTQIRKRIRRNQPFGSFLDPDVYHFIKKNDLYLSE